MMPTILLVAGDGGGWRRGWSEGLKGRESYNSRTVALAVGRARRSGDAAGTHRQGLLAHPADAFSARPPPDPDHVTAVPTLPRVELSGGGAGRGVRGGGATGG